MDLGDDIIGLNFVVVIKSQEVIMVKISWQYLIMRSKMGFMVVMGNEGKILIREFGLQGFMKIINRI